MLLCWGCERAGQEFLRTESPGGTYVASFVGRPERPGMMFQEHRVRLRIWQRQNALVDDREIHFGDWFDDAFEYGRHEWVRENVLRVGAGGHELDDLLIVRNESSGRLVLSRIWAEDMLFILDLDPGDVLHLPVGGRMRSRYIGIDGLWGNGQELEPSGASFDSFRSPTQFTISIRDDGTAVGRTDRLMPSDSSRTKQNQAVFTGQ